jgi:DNA-directed RNA polymerase specialized sigma24 family protein
MARVLEPYRADLTLIARRAIGPELAGKVGASDLVQETFLAAQQHVASFRGRTEPAWRAWLKAILLNHLANQRRDHAAGKRQGPRGTGEHGGTRCPPQAAGRRHAAPP